MKAIKRFILRALTMADAAMADEALDTAIKDGLAPRPLQSDIERAKRELEAGKFILGQRDDFDGTVTWTLTTEGKHKAAELR